MRIGRTLPPAAAPIYKYDILQGVKALLQGQVAIDRFRSELKAYFQVKHCFLLSSGKAALFSILQTLKQIAPDRDEVIIPAFTCYSVPSAVVRAGLKVRLCDVAPETLDFNFFELQKITQTKNKLLAIVCPHLFGLPANIERVISVLADPNISVIEDAAQAMGGIVNHRHLGTIGDIGFFSLGRGKAFSAVNGGIIITNSKKIAEKIENGTQENAGRSVPSNAKLMAYAFALSFLTNPFLFWLPKLLPGLKLGETFYDAQFPVNHFSPFQAGLARNWRKRITVFQAQRKQNALYWRKALRRFPWLQPLPIINESMEGDLPLLRFPVLVQNSFLRNALLELSEKWGLGIMVTYPGSIDKIKEFEFDRKGEVFPGAKECVDRILTFPVHGFVSPRDRRKIIRSLDMFQDLHFSEYRRDM